MELFNVCFVLQVAKMPSMSGIVQNATMTIARHHASNLKILGGRIGQVSLGPILKLLKFIRL